MILRLNDTEFVNTDHPLDISLSLHNGDNPVLAWYCDPIKIEPVMTDRFIGDVNKGGAVNFRNVYLNPHANGTHTECVGHISKEKYSINQLLKAFHFKGCLISVKTESYVNHTEGKTDAVITKEKLAEACQPFEQLIQQCEVIIIRTLPNTDEKLTKNYSNSNPPYFSNEAIAYINELGVDHLVVDLPSIDREVDGGELAGHHLFWNYPENPQLQKTITELVYVPDEIKDGIYLTTFQITSLENDASPSKVVLYEILSDK